VARDAVLLLTRPSTAAHVDVDEARRIANPLLSFGRG
jgi:hypothetical protein